MAVTSVMRVYNSYICVFIGSCCMLTAESQEAINSIHTLPGKRKSFNDHSIKFSCLVKKKNEHIILKMLIFC